MNDKLINYSRNQLLGKLIDLAKIFHNALTRSADRKRLPFCGFAGEFLWATAAFGIGPAAECWPPAPGPAVGLQLTAPAMANNKGL